MFKKKFKKKEIKKNLILLIISIISTIILIEISLRIVSPQKLYDECLDPFHPNGNGVDIVLSDYAAWVNKPNYTRCMYQPDTNKKVYLKYNSKGLRLDKEINYTKNKNKKRIILLGDSFVNGNGLDQHETIAYKLQEKLGSSWEVLLLSSDGYGTDLEYILFKEEGLKYEPDIVILFFYPNDFSDSTSWEGRGIKKPRFGLNRDKMTLDLVYPDKSFKINYTTTSSFNKKPISKFLLSHSNLYSLFYFNKDKLNLKKEKKKIGPLVDTTILSVLHNYNYTGTDMNFALGVVLVLFTNFKELSVKNNFEFIVVNIPSKLNVNEKYQKKLIREYPIEQHICCEFNKVNKFFSAELPYYDITYLDLYHIAKNNFNDFYFKSDGHWSPTGVEMTSDYIYNHLAEENLI